MPKYLPGRGRSLGYRVRGALGVSLRLEDAFEDFSQDFSVHLSTSPTHICKQPPTKSNPPFINNLLEFPAPPAFKEIKILRLKSPFRIIDSVKAYTVPPAPKCHPTCTPNLPRCDN